MKFSWKHRTNYIENLNYENMISTAVDFYNSTMFIVYTNVDPSLIVMSGHSPDSVLFVPKYQSRSGVGTACNRSVILTFYRKIMVVFDIIIALHNRVA